MYQQPAHEVHIIEISPGFPFTHLKRGSYQATQDNERAGEQSDNESRAKA